MVLAPVGPSACAKTAQNGHLRQDYINLECINEVLFGFNSIQLNSPDKKARPGFSKFFILLVKHSASFGHDLGVQKLSPRVYSVAVLTAVGSITLAM